MVDWTDEEINERMSEVTEFIHKKHYDIVDAGVITQAYILMCKGKHIHMDDIEFECKKALRELKSFIPRFKEDEDLFKAMQETCDKHFDKLYPQFESIDKLYPALLNVCYKEHEGLIEKMKSKQK